MAMLMIFRLSRTRVSASEAEVEAIGRMEEAAEEVTRLSIKAM